MLCGCGYVVGVWLCCGGVVMLWVWLVLLGYIGVVMLESEHTVCKEGDVLTPEQARILVSLRTL